MTTCGHSPESLAGAVQLPAGSWVQLDDLLFSQHGLGPRYALVQNSIAGGRTLSYAMLDIPGTGYDIITTDEKPRELGTLAQLKQAAGDALYAALEAGFQADHRSGGFATKQQLALALIHAAADGVSPADQLGILRIVRWAKSYERRAWWICTHRVEAFIASTINWRALGM